MFLRHSVKVTETLLQIDLQPLRHFTDVGLQLTGLAFEQRAVGSIPSIRSFASSGRNACCFAPPFLPALSGTCEDGGETERADLPPSNAPEH